MQSFRLSVVAVAVAGAMSGGCIQDTGQCPRPVGSFVGTYTPVSGNCTNIKTRPLMFSEDPEQSMISIINSLSDSVMTEVNLIGCTIAVEQSISDAKAQRMIAHIKGNLAVEDANALSGVLTYQEFLPDGTTQACLSQVEVSYVQQGAAGVAPGQTLGAAAQAALANP